MQHATGNEWQKFSSLQSVKISRELPEYIISLSLFLQALVLVYITVQVLYCQADSGSFTFCSDCFGTGWPGWDKGQKECDCKDIFETWCPLWRHLPFTVLDRIQIVTKAYFCYSKMWENRPISLLWAHYIKTINNKDCIDCILKSQGLQIIRNVHYC